MKSLHLVGGFNGLSPPDSGHLANSAHDTFHNLGITFIVQIYSQGKYPLVFIYPRLTFSAKKFTFLTPLLVVLVYYVCKDFCIYVDNPLRIQI